MPAWGWVRSTQPQGLVLPSEIVREANTNTPLEEKPAAVFVSGWSAAREEKRSKLRPTELTCLPSRCWGASLRDGQPREPLPRVPELSTVGRPCRPCATWPVALRSRCPPEETLLGGGGSGSEAPVECEEHLSHDALVSCPRNVKGPVLFPLRLAFHLGGLLTPAANVRGPAVPCSAQGAPGQAPRERRALAGVRPRARALTLCLLCRRVPWQPEEKRGHGSWSEMFERRLSVMYLLCLWQILHG